MKYNYEKRIIPNGTNQTFSISLPKEIKLVETLLSADVQGDAAWFIEAIDKVLSGKEDYQEFGGNICAIEVKKDLTRVIDTLAEDGIGNACYIETNELRKLIKIWVKEREEFYK